MVAVLAVLGGVLGARQPRVATAGLLGLAAAALWVPALGGEVEVAAVVVALAVLAAALPGAALGRAPLLVVAFGTIEAARLALLGAWGDGAVLAVGGVLVAGAAAAPAGGRPAGLCAVGLAVAALLSGQRGADVLDAPPVDRVAVSRQLALGGAPRSVPTLVDQPALGLWALREDPTAHEVAVALLPTLGPERLVGMGWAPEGAGPQLDGATRRVLARTLEAQGRGGEAVRLLRGDEDDESRWLRLRLARSHGRALDLSPMPDAPADVPRLPGDIALDWALLADGTHVQVLHADRPLERLVLSVRATHWQGAPVIEVQVDADEPVRRAVPTAGEITLDGPVAQGPHRLVLRFVNDARGPDGDRNVWVDRLRAD